MRNQISLRSAASVVPRPLAVPFHHLHHLGRRLLALLAERLVPLVPQLGVHAAIGVYRHERGSRVAQPEAALDGGPGGGHHHGVLLIGGGGLPDHAPLHDLQVDVQADRLQVLGHHLRDSCRLHPRVVPGEQVDLQWFTVEPPAETVVADRQADLVEHRLGLFRIVLEVGVRHPLVVVVAARRARRPATAAPDPGTPAR